MTSQEERLIIEDEYRHSPEGNRPEPISVSKYKNRLGFKAVIEDGRWFAGFTRDEAIAKATRAMLE